MWGMWEPWQIDQDEDFADCTEIENELEKSVASSTGLIEILNLFRPKFVFGFDYFFFFLFFFLWAINSVFVSYYWL